jgi:hypothetical protein
MASSSQRKASATHRRRAAARGLVRVEVQAMPGDTALIRKIAEELRGDTQRARTLREKLKASLSDGQPRTAFDIFRSDLPDEVFDGVFERDRGTAWRDVEL